MSGSEDYSRLSYIIIVRKLMLELNKESFKKKSRLQNKNCGISTKNYVVHQFENKKWLKVKQSHIHNRNMAEAYYYNTLFDQLLRKQRKTSLLSVQDFSITYKSSDIQGQGKQASYYIERPFYTISLKEFWQSGSKDSKFSFKHQLSQIFKLFLQNSDIQLPLFVPSNILLKKRWNGQYSMHLNTTSLVGYQFFIQQSDIFTSKFEEIACYLHPKILNFENKQHPQLEMSFETRLYELKMVVLSLALRRQIALPLHFKSNKNTVNVREIDGILENHYRDIKGKLLKKSIIVDRITQTISNVQGKHINQKTCKGELQKPLQKKLWNLFKQDFPKEQPNSSLKPFKSWTAVIKYYNSQFLSDFVSRQSQQSIRIIKDLFQNEEPTQLQFYKKMGIIHPQLQDTNNVQELVLYFMLKTNEFQELNYLFFKRPQQKTTYAPKHYKVLIKMQQELTMKKKQNNIQLFNPQKQEQQSRQFNCQSAQYELFQQNQSSNYNIFSFELSQNVTNFEGSLKNVENQKKQIYVPNECQKTLDLFGSTIWL